MSQPGRDRREELYRKYLEVPSHQSAEIIHGTLYVMPRPAPRYARAASALQGDLYGPFDRGRGGPGGWWILFEPELQLVPKEPIVPDIAGWRVERMAQLPESSSFELAPDWVCEVLSPGTVRIDREEKLPYYASHRVPHVWLVDPIDQRLEVHVLDVDEPRWSEVRVYHGDAPVRAAPFEAIELDLASLWARTRTP
jgi:Uma2 family endonuclease